MKTDRSPSADVSGGTIPILESRFPIPALNVDRKTNCRVVQDKNKKRTQTTLMRLMYTDFWFL